MLTNPVDWQLTTAYAFTIHKYHGLISPELMWCIRGFIWTIHTAFSRVCRLEEIVIKMSFATDRLDQIRRMGTVVYNRFLLTAATADRKDSCGLC